MTRPHPMFRPGRRSGPVRAVSIGMVVTILALIPGPASAADPFNGKKIWESRSCPTCHGIDGIAKLAGVPHFARGERMEKPDSVLIETITNGTNIMPAWRGLLSRTEMFDVISYIRTLQK